MIRLYSLGCRVNQAELENIKERFINSSVARGINLYIINTCAVTAKAEKKSEYLFKRILKRRHKNDIIILTGCWLQKEKKNLSEKYKSKNIVIIENQDKNQISKYINCSLKQKSSISGISHIPSRTRAYIKISDGCQNRCTYCITKNLRPQKNRQINHILKEIIEKQKAGYQEIILCGINIGQYKYGLVELINKILARTNIHRIRISSINSLDVSDQMIVLFKNPRLVPYLHIPLQSGSDRILHLMKRPYNISQFLQKIKKIKGQIPDIFLATDIIVGFPGERDVDFQKTCDIIKSVGFAKCHIFPYSDRPGTEAQSLQPKIPAQIIKKRSRIITRVSDRLRQKYINQYIGREVDVLFEQQKNGLWYGWSGNYIKVKIRSRKNLKNKIVKIVVNKNNFVR